MPVYPHLTEGPDIGKPEYILPVTSIPAATLLPNGCAGRVVDIRPLLEDFNCYDIVEQFELASGLLAAVTGNNYCTTDVEICVLQACNVYHIQVNDTWYVVSVRVVKDFANCGTVLPLLKLGLILQRTLL